MLEKSSNPSINQSTTNPSTAHSSSSTNPSSLPPPSLPTIYPNLPPYFPLRYRHPQFTIPPSHIPNRIPSVFLSSIAGIANVNVKLQSEAIEEEFHRIYEESVWRTRNPNESNENTSSSFDSNDSERLKRPRYDYSEVEKFVKFLKQAMSGNPIETIENNENLNREIENSNSNSLPVHSDSNTVGIIESTRQAMSFKL